MEETEPMHLVTLHEDRLKASLAKRCENGKKVDIAEDAKKVNQEVFDDCKQKLDATLKGAGLPPLKGRKSGEHAHDAHKHADDVAAIALAKQQASNEAIAKRARDA